MSCVECWIVGSIGQEKGGGDLLIEVPPRRTRNRVWTARSTVTTKKMIALTLLRILPVFWAEGLLLRAFEDPEIPKEIAVERMRRIMVLFAVIFEIGLLDTTPPLRISLRHDESDKKKMRSFVSRVASAVDLETYRSRTRM